MLKGMATRDDIETNLGKRRNKEIKDSKGGAGTKLARAIGGNAGRVNQVLREMEAEGRIFRDVVGRRTYLIRLVEPTAVPTPPAYTNGAVARPKASKKRLEAIDEVLAALSDYPDLLEENKRLEKELAAAEQTIEAQQLQIAALGRQIHDARGKTDVIAEIEKKLAELKKG